MVFNLEHIQYIEDKNLLSGHLLVLMGQDYQAAQVTCPVISSSFKVSQSSKNRHLHHVTCRFIIVPSSSHILNLDLPHCELSTLLSVVGGVDS